MAEMQKLDDLELETVSGGIKTDGEKKWKWVMTKVQDNYVALRSEPVNDFKNELARMVNGTAFQILPEKTDGEYVYSYFNGQEGWVNSKYITGFVMHGAPY